MAFVAEPVKQFKCGKCGHFIDGSAGKPLTKVPCPQCGATVKVPAAFDHFLIYDCLGTGATGHVFRAFDTRLRREVAIKVLIRTAEDLGRDVGEQILAEARTLASLRHDNVVNIYSLGEHLDQSYIVMEMLSGGTARQFASPDSRLGEAALLNLGIAVADGLGAALAVGLIHLDVKPANILYDAQGRAKLIDFGTAKHKLRDDQTNGVVGTPYYMAPEIATNKPADYRSDMYSLGASLFHLLTGRPPFDAPSVMETLMLRLKQPAPSVREFRPDVSPQTQRVIARMLAVEPGERFESYDALLDALRAAREALDAPPPAEDVGQEQSVHVATAADRRTPRIIMLVAAAATAAMVLVLVILAMMAMGKKDSSPDPSEMTDANPPPRRPAAVRAPVSRPVRPPSDGGLDLTLADFEGSNYGKWKTIGGAFGRAPVDRDDLPASFAALRTLGGKLVISRDALGPASRGQRTGMLISPTFVLSRDYIHFLIGGGMSQRLELRLIVDDRVVRSATGQGEPRLRYDSFDVRVLSGKPAKLMIVDESEAPELGYIAVDHVVLSNTRHLETLAAAVKRGAVVTSPPPPPAPVSQPASRPAAPTKLSAPKIAKAHTAPQAANALVAEPPGAVELRVKASRSTGIMQRPEYAFDGDVASLWNAGTATGAEWIEADLGASLPLSGLALVAAQGQKGPTTHEVRVADKPIEKDPANGRLVHTFEGTTEDRQELATIFPPGTTGRYVQVRTTASPGWVAWRRIHVNVPRPTSPRMALDRKVNTWWTGQGTGSWIQFDLDGMAEVDRVLISFGYAASRRYKFDVQASEDGKTWHAAGQYHSDGKTTGFQTFKFARPVRAAHVKLTLIEASTKEYFHIREARLAGPASVGGPLIVPMPPPAELGTTIAHYKFDGEDDEEVFRCSSSANKVRASAIVAFSEKRDTHLRPKREMKRKTGGHEYSAAESSGDPRASIELAKPGGGYGHIEFAIANQRDQAVLLTSLRFLMGSNKGQGQSYSVLTDQDNFQGPIASGMSLGGAAPTVADLTGLTPVRPGETVKLRIRSYEKHNASTHYDDIEVRGRFGVTSLIVEQGEASDEVIASADPAEAATGATGKGIVTEYWLDLNGGEIDDLIKQMRDQPKPDRIMPLKALRSPEGFGEHYGQRIRCWIWPPMSGLYTFTLKADDRGELYLGTGPDQSTKRLICSSHNNQKKSDPIQLSGNRPYYLEVLHVEEGGGDHLAVGWYIPDGEVEQPIPANRLSASASRLPPLGSKRRGEYVRDQHTYDFAPLRPISASSAHGATLTGLEDGSILVGGVNKPRDVYTVKYETPLAKIIAFRLEVLPDASLPNEGPGRGTGGSFYLSDLELTAAPLGRPAQATRVPLGEATDDFTYSAFKPKYAIDRKQTTRWGITRRPGIRRILTFRPTGPVGSEKGAVLTFTFRNQVSMGRFRVLATLSKSSPILATPRIFPGEVHLNFGPTRIIDRRRNITWESAREYRRGSYGYVGGQIRHAKSGQDLLLGSYAHKPSALRLDVPKGKYRVSLIFAEPDKRKRDERLFRVVIEGKPSNKDIDIYAEVGDHKAFVVNAEVEVTDDALDIRFQPTKGDAIISAAIVKRLRPTKKPTKP